LTWLQLDLEVKASSRDVKCGGVTAKAFQEPEDKKNEEHKTKNLHKKEHKTRNSELTTSEN
jgi:hypothetical protein